MASLLCWSKTIFFAEFHFKDIFWTNVVCKNPKQYDITSTLPHILAEIMALPMIFINNMTDRKKIFREKIRWKKRKENNKESLFVYSGYSIIIQENVLD